MKYANIQHLEDDVIDDLVTIIETALEAQGITPEKIWCVGSCTFGKPEPHDIDIIIYAPGFPGGIRSDASSKSQQYHTICSQLNKEITPQLDGHKIDLNIYRDRFQFTTPGRRMENGFLAPAYDLKKKRLVGPPVPDWMQYITLHWHGDSYKITLNTWGHAQGFTELDIPAL